MGVQVQVGVPTPVLTEGPLQCGADGAGARRGRGKCAEQAHHNQQKSKVSEGLHDAKNIFMSGAAPGGGSRSVRRCEELIYEVLALCVPGEPQSPELK